VFDRSSAWHFARNAAHSTSSIRTPRSGVSYSFH
jgi:hypothetical protein